MKKNIIRFIVMSVLLLACSVFSFAESYVSANDLAVSELTGNMKVDNTFTITATPDKGVSITKCDPATAADGEVFNQRIKLGGVGSSLYRSVIFTAPANAKITVYFKSSSKTDSRVLRAVTLNADGSDGAEVAAMTAIPDDLKSVGMESFTVPAAGSYYLVSKSSTIYVYEVSIE